MDTVRRPGVELGVVGACWVVGNVLAALVAVGVSDAAGWDLGAIAGDGAEVGRASIRVAGGAAVDRDVVPIWGTAVFQIPFWVALMTSAAIVAGGFGAVIGRYGVTHRLRSIPLGVFAGLACQLLLVPLLYIVLFSVFGEADVGAPARALAARVDGAVGAIVFVAFVGLAAPVAEELAFRGVLLSALEQWIGAGAALVVSSAVFAAVHFQLVQFPGLFVFGLIAGWLAQRTGGLAAPIAAHMAFNGTAALALLQS